METQQDTKDTAREIGAAAEDKVEAMVDAAHESIVSAIKPAKESMQTFAERQKALGAEQIDSVARAAHRAAQEVEKELPGVARSVHDAAGRLDAASSSLREQSLEDMMENLGDVARKRPAAFFGGAVLAGFALSRFLKASATHR